MPLTAGGATKVDFTIPIAKSRLWSPEDPFLYELRLSTLARSPSGAASPKREFDVADEVAEHQRQEEAFYHPVACVLGEVVARARVPPAGEDQAAEVLTQADLALRSVVKRAIGFRDG